MISFSLLRQNFPVNEHVLTPKKSCQSLEQQQVCPDPRGTSPVIKCAQLSKNTPQTLSVRRMYEASVLPWAFIILHEEHRSLSTPGLHSLPGLLSYIYSNSTNYT